MVYTESIRGMPYRRKEDIAAELGISKGTVRARVLEIEAEADRYGDLAIIRDGNIVLINTLVFLDYEKYRKQLRDKNARKYTPPFRPEDWMQACGWHNKIVTA
jgi:hypothetical protein